ncbi:methyltransferase implicated in translation [Schizosaccharomyces octosporus yFS286]|uniref:Alpha N-terminal protein methyltransferase 1 n=1 Tax=Schizosaccharomyces octosporus (strain yFS286) TaxID=483514 RepID=S9PU71_SCHOY|nr:methyltransferase implicated in translation [Schizosaccharomyces octosporus yFS286]EPX72666.1 methyltransferase implicated in translation [Schizosaccharomyces octosporus yFS286]
MNPTKFYSDAIEYWNGIEPSVNGMLGGLGTGRIPQVDAIASRTFLRRLDYRLKKIDALVAADCGAGIGRVTEFVLLKVASHVDIVEPVEKFVSQAKVHLQDKPCSFICTGLQNWTPEKNRYGLIWNQWCLSHLTNDDLVAYLIRCSEALSENGVICIKENVSSFTESFDKEDSSVTRTDDSFRKIFQMANLVIIAESLQHGFPDELYPVKMFALVPKPSN